jgi:hypothetical protein
VECRFGHADGLVFAGMTELSQNPEFKDTFAYLKKQMVVSKDGGTTTLVSDVPGGDDFDILYLQDDIFAAESAAGTVLLDGFSQNAVYTLTTPGDVRFMTNGVEVIGYDWVTNESTVRVTTPGPVCLLAQPGMNFMWKVVIAAAAFAAMVVCLIVVLAARAAHRRKRGTVLGVTGEYKDARFKLKPGEEVVFGRDTELCSVVLSNRSGLVSRRHCGIRYDKSANVYYVRDYSTNGTFLRDGSRLNVSQDNVLRGGSVIYIGNRDNMFRLL